MSKVQEFSELAKAATPGKWETFGDKVLSRVRAMWHDEEDEFGTRFIADCESRNHDADATFIAWCANNRDLLAESLRLKESVESPSEDLVKRIAESVVDMRINSVLSGQKAVKITPSQNTMDEVRFALEALAEAVR